MKLELDETDIQKIEDAVLSKVLNALNKSIDANASKQPYLTRRDASKYFGVAESTLSHWANDLGMPVAQFDGRKMYGKESITNWLKSKEVVLQKQGQTKSPRLVKQS